MNKNPQRGISLYLSVIILAIILAIVLGLSAILFGQIKIVREMGYSVVAFYAADTGIEKVLAMINPEECTESNHCEGKLDNGASYSVITLAGSTQDCDSQYSYCIRSVGTYKETQRAIEVKK